MLEQRAAARPSWWLDAQQQDAQAERRDDAGRRRDELAAARDAAAATRDVIAVERERMAVAVALAAHDRLDGYDADSVDAQVTHVQQQAELRRLFDDVRSLPGVPGPAVDRLQRDVELLMDSAYVSTLAMAFERGHERSDLRHIAAHLDAGVRDRLAAGQDRTDAANDRQAADRDRQHGRNARQRGVLQRAADRE
ncbi:hypothetical protein [Nakamurella endophytica]|uniref:hypothetical protein n=1 Tax=Nakamurella endophytica TaxID=1748367 RepID=UPI001E28A43E|nr:hypothetical protein [Nakamurella endophytica]